MHRELMNRDISMNMLLSVSQKMMPTVIELGEMIAFMAHFSGLPMVSREWMVME